MRAAAARHRRVGAVLVAFCAALAITVEARALRLPSMPETQLPSPAEAMAQARKLFDALDYEAAVPALDRAIALFEPLVDRDPAARPALAEALELRARSDFGLGALDAARADFRRLLLFEPTYNLAAQVSPRVVTLFKEVQHSTIGQIALALDPPDATLELDGRPLAASVGAIPLPAGPHSLMARRVGYRSATEEITVTPGAAQTVTITLERVAAVVTLVTVPPGTEVVVDGVPRGSTETGMLPPSYEEWPSKLGQPASAFSAPFALTELPTGPHVVLLRRSCYRPIERQITIDRPADYRLDPFVLERAVASVYVDSPVQGAQVYLDGTSRGLSPLSLDDVCEGTHLVEVRSPHGRFLQRIDARADAKLTVQGAPRPAFAIVGLTGLPAAYRGPDFRQSVAQALGQTSSISLFVPPDAAIQSALQAESLGPGWLAFDRYGRPAGSAPAAMTATARREISERLSKALEAQGVAEVSMVPGGVPGQMIVTLLASGSGEPDVLDLMLDDAASTSRVIDRLDRPLTLFRPSIGLFAMDVLGVDGAVVIRTDPGGAAAASGLAPGDRVIGAGNTPVADAGALQAALAKRKAGDRVAMEVVDRSGAKRSLEVAVSQEPRLIAMNDQSLLFNRLAAELRAVAATSAGRPLEVSVARLNLAVVLMRLGNWSQAQEEIERVSLPAAAGVSSGTVQYLLGLCHQAQGRMAEAERAWRAAAAVPDALLTEDGPAVKDLAERQLAALAGRGR